MRIDMIINRQSYISNRTIDEAIPKPTIKDNQIKLEPESNTQSNIILTLNQLNILDTNTGMTT